MVYTSKFTKLFNHQPAHAQIKTCIVTPCVGNRGNPDQTFCRRRLWSGSFKLWVIEWTFNPKGETFLGGNPTNSLVPPLHTQALSQATAVHGISIMYWGM